MNNIKTARINANLSQKEIAITLGVSVPTVSDWESGKKFPSGKNLIKLAQVLRTTTDFLLGCEDTKKEPTSVAESGLPMMIRIRELREARGMQQKELAIDLCVSQPTISDWESGRKVPSARSTQKLADYFNVSIDYLLGRTDEKEKPVPESGDGQSPIDEKRLDEQLVQRLCSLTPEEQGKVDAFIQGLLSSRQKPGRVIYPAGK